MKIGLVCPYSLDVHGGVQEHILDLAPHLMKLGHQVAVLAPATDRSDLPDYVSTTGRSIPVPYNGSVARITFSPSAYKHLRKWILEEEFDVLHIHEPNAPSLSMLALAVADCPIVATFHAATKRSRLLRIFQGVLRPYHEKISGKIAVSELARQWQMTALHSDAVEIPNGVNYSLYAQAKPLAGYPRSGYTIGFLGRFDEERKGIDILINCAPAIIHQYPDIEFLIVGYGDQEALYAKLGSLAPYFRILGPINNEEKASFFASIDIYCAPQLYGESFGIVLIEAMSAGRAIVASDLPAFYQILDDGKYGVLVPRGDAQMFGKAIIDLLTDTVSRKTIAESAQKAAYAYDWDCVAETIVKVYETVALTPVNNPSRFFLVN